MSTLAVKYRPKVFEDVTSQNYTIKILNKQIKNKKIKNAYLFAGASGCGKALANGTKVVTKGGYKNIENLKIGEYVAGLDGNFYKVTGVYPQGLKKTAKVNFRSGLTIIASLDHLWLYRPSTTYNHQPFVVDTTEKMMEDLKKYSTLVIEACDPIKFKPRVLRLDAILYGFLFRNLKVDTNNRAYITYSSEFSEDIKNLLIHNNIKFEKEGDRYYLSDVDSYGNIARFYQITEYKIRSERVIVPEIVWGCPVHKIEFLKGYFLLTPTKSYKTLTFTTSNMKLLKNFEILVGSLGGGFHYYEALRTSANAIVYRVTLKFLSKIYKSLNVDIKENTKKMYSLNHFIDSIEEYKEKECTCISVDSPNHLFLIESFIPTHNTTVARIFANEVNNGQNPPIELDAASNNGVEEIRKLIKESYFSEFNGGYKVYIIDEAHSLTNQSWQAFLKTLEEPPAKTIFIFCTTEPNKIPNTILNRLQRFNFIRMTEDEISNRLSYIVKQEKLDIKKPILNYIARISRGGMRDAITNLEKCLSFTSKLEEKIIVKILNEVNYEELLEFFTAIDDSNESLRLLNDIYLRGNDLYTFWYNWVNFLVEVYKYIKVGLAYTVLPGYIGSKIEKDYYLEEDDEEITADFIAYIKAILKESLELLEKLKYESNPKLFLDSYLIARGDINDRAAEKH